MGAAIDTMTTTGGNSVQPAGLASGLTHEVKLTFTRGTDTTQAPVVNRWTLLSNPAPERRIQIEIWIRLDSEIESTSGSTYRCNPIEEREQINAWLESNQVITFQDSEAQYAVTVNDIKWAARANVDALNRQWNGTLWVRRRSIRSARSGHSRRNHRVRTVGIHEQPISLPPRFTARFLRPVVVDS